MPESVAHLLVETAEWSDGGEDGFARAAEGLAGTGARVTLVLEQDAIGGLTAAPGLLTRVLAAGITVLADEFSLRQHAIAPAEVPAGVDLVDADRFAELLLASDVRVVWH